MRKLWIALVAIPLLVGCKTVVEQKKDVAPIMVPKAAQAGAVDHAYAQAYADLAREEWVRGVIVQSRVKEAEMILVRDEFLRTTAAFAMDAYGWPPRTESGDAMNTTWAISEQEDATQAHRLINGLGCVETQLLMQAFEQVQAGQKGEAELAPQPAP